MIRWIVQYFVKAYYNNVLYKTVHVWVLDADCMHLMQL